MQPGFHEAPEPTVTTWHNPTDKVQVVRLLKHVGKHPKSHADVNQPITYTFQPGETKRISSEYDRAIHTLGPDGKMIMGGLAPYLVKVGSDEVLHSGLDLEVQAQKANERAKGAAEMTALAKEISMAVPGKAKEVRPAK